MHQILQDIRKGNTSLISVPAPVAQPGEVLIANACSLVSAGTEKMVIDLAKKSLLGKARERPDHVRRVLDKIRNEGLLTTIRQVLEKLDEPMTMGYSSAGVVVACGADVQEYQPGDRVASNGPHAEIVAVPKNLCARVPENVPFEHAAFTVLGSIAMQGVRLARVNLGETVLVIGLGLVGQITVGLLRASGCRVIGVDLDPAKCELAKKMGAEIAHPGVTASEVFSSTSGLGADAVLITASTKSNQPITLAADAVRQKGRVVLVGVVGLELDRRPFYFKEAEFVVSCSYGPGRYDPKYEQQGQDYPAAYVRWTEQRNMQAVLDLMASGKLDVAPLVSHRFAIEDAVGAYDLIEKGNEPYLGILLEYARPIEQRIERRIQIRPSRQASRLGIGVLGVGNFARMVLLPAIRKCEELHPVALCSARGTSAEHSAQKLGFEVVATDEDAVINDPNVNAVFCITQHDQHARQVLKSLRAGKHVFVEKPLCLTTEQLQEIDEEVQRQGENAPLLMVGFNRRFSPAAIQAKQLFGKSTAPLTISMRFNAGPIPADHWTQDLEKGGGRIIGEACHGIDLATYFAGSPPVRVFAESIGGPNAPPITDDQCFITLRHANGSVSNIAYLAGGDKSFPKERVEVIGDGRIAIIDDFRSLTTCAGGKTKTQRLRQQDKGHQAEVRAFAAALAGKTEAPISWEDIRNVTLASLLAQQSLREGQPFDFS